MDIKELNYYKEVVECGSILKASEKLHISQPPLSRMMKNLEIELKCQLFIRGRTLKLTDAGKLLYEKAQAILDLTNSSLRELENLNKTEGHTLNIGIVSSSTSLLYNKNLTNYYKKHPNTKFKIVESNTFNLLDMLDKRIINLAITRTPFDTTQYKTIQFKKEPMVLTSNTFLGETIKLSDISNKKIVIYRRFSKILSDLFKRNNLILNIVALVDDAKTAILLANTLGVSAIVPEGAYKTIGKDIYSSIIDEKSLVTSLTAVTRLDEDIEEKYLDFIKYLSL
jgi:DNA-binding transcriptional LysR family regulator